MAQLVIKLYELNFNPSVSKSLEIKTFRILERLEKYGQIKAGEIDERFEDRAFPPRVSG